MNPDPGGAVGAAHAPAQDPGRQALRIKVALGALIGGALLALTPARWAALPDLCAFHLQTGLPCPGCGLTRSWSALAHLDLAGAFRYHLFGPPLLLATLLWLFGGRWGAWMRRVPVAALILVGVVWMLYWILRLKGFFPIP